MNQTFLPVAENSQAAEIDRSSIEDYGVPSIALMETAGSKTADLLSSRTQPDHRIAVICGKGNNGGDALAAARQLHAAGRNISLYMTMGDNDLSPDADTNYRILKTIAAQTDGITFYENFDELISSPVDWWVDGIFGTGLNSEVRQPVASIIDLINGHAAPVLALDMPSGLHGTTGQVLGSAIRADLTIMYGIAKLGGFIGHGPEYCGERHTVVLGFTGPAMSQINRFLIHGDETISTGPDQKFEHKYKAGIVYLLAGSQGMTGAAVMAAKAAWSAGAGGVVVFTPAGLLSTYELHLPEAVKIPVGTEQDYWFKPEHYGLVQEQIKQQHPHVILAGPGAGGRSETSKFFRELLATYSGKLVLDADAVNVLSDSKIQRPRDQRLVITPHTGEFSEVSGFNGSNIYERLLAAEDFAGKHSLCMILKGSPTLVVDNHHSWLTTYDTTAFSRFGFGDVLSGMIATTFLHLPAADACTLAMLRGFQRLKLLYDANPNAIAKPFDLIT